MTSWRSSFRAHLPMVHLPAIIPRSLTSDEKIAMNEMVKPIKRDYSVLMGKTKSDGSSGSSSKAMRFDKTEAAYEKSAFANQRRGEYYELLADNRRDPRRILHFQLPSIVGPNKAHHRQPTIL